MVFVKLKRDFTEVLVSLATYDNLTLICIFFLFSMKELSVFYESNIYYYISPYLFPLTITFMTCSSYMTAAVAVNRFMDVISADMRCQRPISGYSQAVIVLLCATVVNIPR